MRNERIIVHADMDAFYAAVEQLDRPELRGKPVIVGGTTPRGVVTTASYEARVFGVRSAMPAVEARRLCPDGIYLPVRMSRYVEVAMQIRAVFGEFTPLVEPVSVDEAFLDVSGSVHLFDGSLALGKRLKGRVREATSLTVSVGIAPCKLVAKICSDLNKPDGLLEVKQSEVRDFLRPLPIRRLWGIGPATAVRLGKAGITTIGELAECSDATLRRFLGNQADHFRRLARGEDDRAVHPSRERKSYGEERTFESDVRDGERVRDAIRLHADAIARRLRHDGVKARTITLKMKLAQPLGGGRYPSLNRSLTLPAPTDDGRGIGDVALRLWRDHHGGNKVRLIGVSASGIGKDEGRQLGLFAAPGKERSALNQAVDSLLERYGADTVRRGKTN